MQVVDFFNLERSLQDRFVEAASGAVPPAPLAFRPAPPGAAVIGWWAGCGAAILAVLGMLTRGFGSLESPLALLGPTWIGVLALTVAFAVFAALRALSLDHARDSLPFRAGSYVFPIGVVDAAADMVKVYRFSELGNVSQSGRSVTFSFEGGTSFTFQTPSAAVAEQLLQQVEQNRSRVSSSSGPASSRELAALDPLADTGFKSPFTPNERRQRSSPRWLRFGWIEAVLAGIVLGPILWKGRNVVSEERLYTAARSLGTSGAFEAYLARGGTRPDVTDVLLPRAELSAAIAKGSVADLEAFMARGKHQQIDVEVQAALRKALLEALERVAAQNSLTKLNEFEQQQEHRALIKAEIDSKRHDLYQKAAQSFAAVAQPSTSALLPAIGRLLTYVQKNGPEVQIAFRRRTAENSEKAENQLTKSAYFMGGDAMPSKYFRPEDWERREQDLGNALAERLNREFPADILHFKVAPAIADDGSDTPKMDKPTLLITHRDELAGAFMSKKPRGAFIGLGLLIKSQLLIPGDDQPPLSFKFSVWLAPDLHKTWEIEGATPKSVYEALAMDGFNKFSKKQLQFLLKTP